MVKPSRSRLPRPLLWSAAAGALALAIWGGVSVVRQLGASGSRAPDELTATAIRGPLTISFIERGTIKAARSEQVYSQLEGMSTIVNVVPEGTSVKQGDLLMELDSSELTQSYNQQQIAVETSQAALLQANEAVEIQKSQNESDTNQAKLAVDLADIDVRKYEEGDWPLSLSTSKADIHIAEEELKRAENRYSWTEKLAARGYVTRTELVADDLAVKKAKVQLEQAQGALRVLEKYTREKDSKKIASDLLQARRALDRADLKARSQMAQVVADQKGKQSTYNLSNRRLEKIKDQLDKTKIRAPQDGMVVYHQDGRYGRDDRIIEQGGNVRENQHMFDLPDLTVMAVTVQVPEARIHQVTRGLRATVTIDAQNELVLGGSVTKIGLLPDYVNRWMNPDLKVYQTEITIDVDQDTSLLRPGMSAKAEILVENLEDVVYVPVQSVTTIDGAPVCYVWSEGRFAPRPVVLGASNDSFIVIRSGLLAGDVLRLNAPAPTGAPPRKDNDREPDAAVSPAGYPAPESREGGRGDKRAGGDARAKGDESAASDGRGGEGGEGRRKKSRAGESGGAAPSPRAGSP